MNYIELINFFWTANEEHSFRTTDIALYFYLLKVNNDCSWKESFKRNNRKVEVDLGISFNTLKDSRNRLKNANLINFKTVNGDANVSYTIINTSSKFDKVTNEVSNEVPTEVSTRLVPSKDKLNKTKLKENTLEIDAEVIDEFSFEKVWDFYDKKVGDKEKLRKKYEKLPAGDKQKIFEYIPAYKEAQPDKKFRKNLETFLNNKSWNDELIFDNGKEGQNKSTNFNGGLSKSGQNLVPVGDRTGKEKDYSTT
jgi:hypothetical protein